VRHWGNGQQLVGRRGSALYLDIDQEPPSLRSAPLIKCAWAFSRLSILPHSTVCCFEVLPKTSTGMIPRPSCQNNYNSIDNHLQQTCRHRLGNSNTTAHHRPTIDQQLKRLQPPATHNKAPSTRLQRAEHNKMPKCSPMHPSSRSATSTRCITPPPLEGPRHDHSGPHGCCPI
jgi:hypothetical protein